MKYTQYKLAPVEEMEATFGLELCLVHFINIEVRLKSFDT